MIRFGHGRVSPHGVQGEIVLALVMIEPIFRAAGYECIITSLTDGLHGPTTLHPKGLAVDLRSHHLPVAGKAALLAAMREALPPYYEVYLENPGQANEHYHVEYDYKGEAP